MSTNPSDSLACTRLKSVIRSGQSGYNPEWGRCTGWSCLVRGTKQPPVSCKGCSFGTSRIWTGTTPQSLQQVAEVQRTQQVYRTNGIQSSTYAGIKGAAVSNACQYMSRDMEKGVGEKHGSYARVIARRVSGAVNPPPEPNSLAYVSGVPILNNGNAVLKAIAPFKCNLTCS